LELKYQEIGIDLLLKKKKYKTAKKKQGKIGKNKNKCVVFQSFNINKKQRKKKIT
jgi:hypothetical protein